MNLPDRVEMIADGVTVVASVVYHDGERLGRYPGDDISDLPAGMQATINAAWTSDVVTTYQAAKARREALAAIQGRRDQAILAFSFAGHPVPLTDKTQQDIGNAVQALGRQSAGSTVAWEIADGVYVDMDLPTVQAMGDAGFAHVQACFANSKALTALLDAAKPYDLESGWPS